MKKILCLICILLTTAIFADDKIVTLPGIKKLDTKQYAGYLTAGNHNKLFYWFVTSKNKKAPIIIWSNGGPGYSSMYGFFNETGPYFITKNSTLIENKHGWHHFSNYLVIDQPVGVGMSNLPDNKILSTPTANTKAYYHALKSFFKKHPSYKNNKVFLAGESYAGTYLPLLAKTILQKNKTAKNKITLAGLILISPWADPKTQMSMDTTYAFSHGIISSKQKQHIDKIAQQCFNQIKSKDYSAANTTCSNIDNNIQKDASLWLTNINHQSNDDNSIMDHYLNSTSVRKATHATKTLPYHAWSDAINKRYTNYTQRSVAKVYNYLLLKKIPILIVSGLSDAKDTNFLGVDNFINHLSWSEKKTFLSAKTKPIIINKHVLGYQKSSALLNRVTIRHAGHLIPQDQPNLDFVVKRYINSIS